ncbi:sucrase ferredoxin [Devosia sp.]|uniref:sucrase ferredoxin n=1 Tax=Devosia sp. TaxID=1871048 RepID=UPI002FC69229
MRAGQVFCTDFALAQKEPLAGTGAMAERHLFIRWPKGKWRRPRYESAGMDAALQQAIHQSYGPGRYVGLLESDGQPDLQLVSFPDGRTALPSSQQEAAELIRAWAGGTALEGPALPRPVILCCTDAKVNACCALYGFPIYKALREQAGGFGFDVMQCTHFGGCHFAPSLIVMPQRSRYGRLTPADIPAFLASIAAGDYYLPAFKGRPDLSEIDQCVEIAAAQWADARGYRQRDIRLLGPALDTPTGATAHAQAGPARLRVELQQQSFHVHGTCRSVAEDDGKIVLRWVVTSIAETTELGPA